MEDFIHDTNICPCKKEDCVNRWFEGKEDHYIENSWHQYHCSKTTCHQIFDGRDYGVKCSNCHSIFCDGCEDSDEDLCEDCQRFFHNSSDDSDDEIFDGRFFK